MPMKNPAHPGRLIKNACLEPLGLSITDAANVLDVSRNSLSRVIARLAAAQAALDDDVASRE